MVKHFPVAVSFGNASLNRGTCIARVLCHKRKSIRMLVDFNSILGESIAIDSKEHDDGDRDAEFLSYDLVPSILVEANNETIFTCFCVSRSWNLFANDNYLFQQITNKRYDLKNYKKSVAVDWKWVFFSKMRLRIPTTASTGAPSKSPAQAELSETSSESGSSCPPPNYLAKYHAGEIGSKQIAGGLFEGEFKEKKRHGVGIYYWQTDNPTKFQVRYCGEWVEGKRTGNGYCDWKSGSVYVGQFMNDQICGSGKFIWSNGDVYDGHFDENGNKSGFGEFRWKTGNKYEGYWELSKRSGQGKFTWYNGDVYEGEWKNDVKSGKGKLIWNNGNSFDGVWVNGQKERGTMFEHVSNRTFDGMPRFRRCVAQALGNFDDGEVHLEFLHPEIIDCIERKVCTSLVTGKNCYFQYLWQTNECSDRNQCVEKNYTSLLDPHKRYLGGNFFCECGMIFGSSCRSKTPQSIKEIPEMAKQETLDDSIFK